MSKPLEGEYAPSFKAYVALVKGESLNEIIANHASDIHSFYNNLPEGKADYRYAEDKWTIKELLQHIIDAERIFSYRALRIARKDATPLSSFDENAYTDNSNANSRTLLSLKEEFNAVREATDLLLQSFTPQQLDQTGTASNHPVKVNAIMYIIYGHLLHHINIIQQRYL